ncbi:CBO0543 family protein [Virgibacillus sp. CBA3643]|uniref:CBO0543 family protein n=1 Tax=Virgibacillus sp. CBA3643 TaxID=2942278 RepID=UPI0035A2D3B8
MQIIERQARFVQLKNEYFFESIIFSYQWWFLLIIAVGLWIVWAIVVDKKRLNAILLVGFMASMIALILDELGLFLALWVYAHHLAPFTHKLLTVDIAIIPVSYMLLYQHARKWKPYLIKLGLLSLFAVFVAEPIFGVLDIYILLGWKHWYSTPFYFLIGVFVKWMADKIAGDKGFSI